MFDTEFTTIKLEQEGICLHVTLNRPQARNAMSLVMVKELMQVCESLEANQAIRAVLLRGEGGHFCAGGDIKDMAHARSRAQSSDSDPFFELNKSFGELILKINHLPQVVIAVLEGAVLGGGFGLACVSDVAIATPSANFGMPETTLGIPPAQIAPFVVKRIGLTQARRLALLGIRFDGEESVRLGISHYLASSEEALLRILGETLDQIKKCAPEANAMTKKLMLKAAEAPAEALISDAAEAFSRSVQGAEGAEGTMAFVQKRLPEWAK